MIRFWAMALVLAATTPVAWAADKEAEGPFDPNEFVLSYWSGPPAAFNTLERYKEVKEANFTVAFPADNGLTVEENKKMLDFCQQVGLKAIVSDGRMCQAIGGACEISTPSLPTTDVTRHCWGITSWMSRRRQPSTAWRR
jgi:hypothetical protein